MNDSTQGKLLSFGFILSVVFLLLNDFCLKFLFPGVLTGILSDFSGLFAFPFFFSAIFPSRKKLIYSITAIAFVLWKLPMADYFIDFWNRNMPYNIGRVVDYWDLGALLILPISYNYKPNVSFQKNRKIKISFAYIFAIISIFSFLATAGTHGKIKPYYFTNSKYNINKAIKECVQVYPEYKVPKAFEFYIRELENAGLLRGDTVDFHFYNKIDSTIIWTGFSGVADDWTADHCELALIGYIKVGHKWVFNETISKEDKKQLTDFFEKDVIEKINRYLSATPGL